MTKDKKTGLDLLREPFPSHQISKLPKPTKKQTDEVRNNFKSGVRCKLCGQWHHPDVVHLDYVGHAALTDRLLDCDPEWNWSPVSFAPDGTPAIDANGGMWIKLSVCGVERLGYGHPDGKRGGDAVKEVIGDALRNAAMRFGAALDLWHKGDLHVDDDDQPAAANPPKQQRQQPQRQNDGNHYDKKADDMIAALKQHGVGPVTSDKRFQTDLAALKSASPETAARVEAEIDTQRKAQSADLGGDNIPY